MKVKVSDSLKGILVIKSLKKKVMKGKEFLIDDKNIYESDIQNLVKKGILIPIEDIPDERRRLVISNNRDNALVIGNVHLKSNETLVLDPNKVDMKQIRIAEKNGNISIIDYNEKNHFSNSNLDPKDEEEEWINSQINQIQEEVEEDTEWIEEQIDIIEGENKKIDTLLDLGDEDAIEKIEDMKDLDPDKEKHTTFVWNFQSQKGEKVEPLKTSDSQIKVAEGFQDDEENIKDIKNETKKNTGRIKKEDNGGKKKKINKIEAVGDVKEESNIIPPYIDSRGNFKSNLSEVVKEIVDNTGLDID